MATASHLVWFAHTHLPSRDRPPPASASTLPARESLPRESLPRAGCFGGRGLGGCLPSCATKSSRTLSTLGGGEGEGFLAPPGAPASFAAVTVEELAEEDEVDIAQSSASSSSSEAAAAGERSSISTSSPAVSPRPLDTFLAACDRALAARAQRRAGPAGGEAGQSAAVGPFPQEPQAQLEDIQVRFENIQKQKNEDNPERAQPLPPTDPEFLIGSDSSSRQDQEGQKKGLQEEVEANPGKAAGSTIPPGRRTDRPSPPASSFAAGPLLRAAGASLPPPPPPQAEWGAMGKVEGWLGGGGAKPRAAVQLPEDSAESSATRVDVDVGSGSEETAEHAAAAKIQDAWRRSPQRIRPEDSASNVGSALSQHTSKSGPGSAQGARLGFVLAAWGVAAVATVAKAAVSKARAAAQPPKVRYQRHCFAPKFADRLNAPTVCVRVPEQIVIDLRADPKVMQVPTLEIQQPSPRPPKALAPSK